ncbi:MAG: zinc ribbon domain-containing protein [Promethearchaeota archaeon]|nr:MAG: zinc ribbon domain-containing protein [Candidatus Lokiarchaeota archaeon]
MSNIFPDNSAELSETQKMGRAMRWYGFARLALIVSTFLVTFIASSAVLPGIDPDAPDYITIYEAAVNAYLERTWVRIYFYVFEAVVVVGLGIFVFSLYPMFKSNEVDENFSKVYYLFLTNVVISSIAFVLSIFINLSTTIAWITIILNIAIPALSIAGYVFMRPWSIAYEQQMGSSYPILSSRIRRLFLGEILVLSGLFFTLFSVILGEIFVLGSFLGAFSLVGEVLVILNLMKAGKLLTLETFPQIQGSSPFGQQFRPPQGPAPRHQQEYPEYRPPQKLIPDKAYFCPSCGAVLVSETADFCMKCGKPIPKPQTDRTTVKILEAEKEPGKWRCRFCGTENPDESSVCEGCGENGKPK